ncbi:MAG: UDP-N-acetylmuramoyl-L-alanyl-D-glutamate--2,6-diaminopimelate ligase, partial [Massilia sp.]
MAMSLDNICDWIRAAAPGGRLVSDSRRVAQGDVFFAYPGEGADGRSYIAAAVSAGAAAVVYEGDGFEWDASHDVAHLAVTDLKKNAGPIAHGVL